MPKSDPETAVAIRPEQSLSRSAPNVADMLQAVLTKGVTAENVAAVEQIVKLYEHMQAKDAEKDFAAAFNALQSEMPGVRATVPVPNNDGTVRYRFAPYEDVMEQVAPMLQKHGFTIAFSTRYEDSRLIKICTLQHTSGHKQSNEFAVRIGKGPPGASETQADGAAGTYAKRLALCDALNIVIERERDNDPRAEGALISPEQAQSLKSRVHATGSDERAFLKFAGASTYEQIRADRYPELDQNLRRKEKTT